MPEEPTATTADIQASRDHRSTHPRVVRGAFIVGPDGVIYRNVWDAAQQTGTPKDRIYRGLARAECAWRYATRAESVRFAASLAVE